MNIIKRIFTDALKLLRNITVGILIIIGAFIGLYATFFSITYIMGYLTILILPNSIFPPSLLSGHFADTTGIGLISLLSSTIIIFIGYVINKFRLYVKKVIRESKYN